MDDTIAFFRRLGKKAYATFRLIKDPCRVVGTNPLGQKTMRIDAALEELAVGMLEKSRIGSRLVTEEKGGLELKGKRGVVVMDPLDGSNNFRKGVPSYGMAVSYAEGDAYSDITSSYIIDLACGTEYWALHGRGAFRDGKRVRTSGETMLERSILEYDPNMNQAIYHRITPLLKKVKDVRRFGANALALCYIATGAHHLFVDLDNGLSVIHAPGLRISEEAGAVVSDAKGRPINPRLREDEVLSFVCSANAVLHKKALKLVR